MGSEPSDRPSRLVPATPRLQTALTGMASEWRTAGDVRYTGVLDDFPGWLQFIRDRSRQENCPEGIVPQDHLFLLDGNRCILGGCRLRHTLTAPLLIEGGHIGYDVRPTRRREGHATRILELALLRASRRGITRVLVTCNEDNAASVRVIEKNGGVETEPSISEPSGKAVRRFWIEV